MFKIGEFSKLSSTSIRMLRHYDEIGLLKPRKIDDVSNFRYYSANQLEKINKINVLKRLGFSLTIIKEILENDVTNIQKYLEIREKELSEELENIKVQTKQLHNIQTMLLHDQSAITYDVQYKNITQHHVVSLRRTINNFTDEHQLWQQMHEEIMKSNIKLTSNSMAISVYHDEHFNENTVDIEIQYTIDTLYKNANALSFYTVPITNVASVTFHGPFTQMPQITLTIAKWIETNGYHIDGPTWIISHVSPAMDSNPEHWISEVCYPIQKK